MTEDPGSAISVRRGRHPEASKFGQNPSVRPSGARPSARRLAASGMATIALATALTMSTGSMAFADDVSGSYKTSIGAGSSEQYMAWRKPEEEVRLWVDFDGNPSGTGSRCQDAAVDWNTNGTGHYDARVVRNCNPGHFIATDAGGDGWWEEPNDYDEADVRRVQRVGSYVFKDDDLTAITSSKNKYGNAPSRAAPTSDFAQRIRTLYDNGDISSFMHLPVRCAGDDVWVDYPGSDGGACV